MASVAIRQSGGGNIVTLPKSVVSSLGLEVGSKLSVTVEGNNIVLVPELTLEELLAGSPKECFELTQEDQEWVNSKPVGNEAL